MRVVNRTKKEGNEAIKEAVKEFLKVKLKIEEGEINGLKKFEVNRREKEDNYKVYLIYMNNESVS